MGDTSISWTMGDDGTPGKTWNPIRGCSRVSEGCRNCYAERVAARFSKPGQPYHGLAQVVAPRDDLDRHGGRRNGWTRKVVMVPEHLADPLRWRKPRRIFVNSMSDLFHEALTNEQIAAVFGVMAAAPQHTFQCLTKRARRMREWFEWVDRQQPDAPSACIGIAENSVVDSVGRITAKIVGQYGHIPWPLPNVWLGVSVENQDAADERIPDLLATPAAVRFLSCEPLIGPVRLDDIGKGWSALARTFAATMTPRGERVGIDWVIAGCESGPGARPCDVAWLRSLRDQCADTAVPYFLKQAAAARHTLTDAGVGLGTGSKGKPGGIIELPCLDGVQHKEMPLRKENR